MSENTTYLMKESLYKKLEELSFRYHEIAASLEETTVAQNLEKYKALSKEYARLKPLHEGLQQYKALSQSLQNNEAILQDEDPELQSLAIEEKTNLYQQIKEIIYQLEIGLIPEDPDDNRNVFLEIRAAAGGAEAAIFVGDLFKMYSRYAEKQKWAIEIIRDHPSEQGGYKEIILRLMGNAVYSHLKFESGAHRVQRVPTTETQGRIHTSTCTVAVLPEVEAIDEVVINPDELRIDTFRASGAGGQHVQKTDSAIRIIHLPTGITVECQDERSQHKNRARAMSLLQARLLSTYREKQRQEEASTRRSLVGTGERSERIRTYNFPQGRLTDHRINLTLYQLTSILEGQLDLVLHPLKHHYQLEQLDEDSSL